MTIFISTVKQKLDRVKTWPPLCRKTRQKWKTESENLHNSGFFRSCPVELWQNTELKMLNFFSFSPHFLWATPNRIRLGSDRVKDKRHGTAIWSVLLWKLPRIISFLWQNLEKIQKYWNEDLCKLHSNEHWHSRK